MNDEYGTINKKTGNSTEEIEYKAARGLIHYVFRVLSSDFRLSFIVHPSAFIISSYLVHPVYPCYILLCFDSVIVFEAEVRNQVFAA